MTRDEATEKARNAWDGNNTYNENFIDLLIAVGLLPVDEPVAEYEVASQALESSGVRCNSVALRAILSVVGLKVVRA